MAGRTSLAVAASSALCLAPAARAGLTVYDSEAVAARWIVPAPGGLILSVDSRSWDLVTDPASEELSPLGDGAFHPMNPGLVHDAIAELRWAADELPAARVMILPFPRSGSLKSSFEDGTIFLAPGIREVHREHVHSTVAHEIGHLVQQRLAPDGSAEWARYLALRGLRSDRYHAEAAHRNRPHEIFAEDFRHLYGGALAAAAAQENADLAPAAGEAAIVAWFEELRLSAWRGVGQPQPLGFPNPYTGGDGGGLVVRFEGLPEGGRAGVADVFDVTGRAIARLDGFAGESGTAAFPWDGRDGAGRRVASGVYLVRWRDHPGAGTARVHVLH
jgi:hypothetical protein